MSKFVVVPLLCCIRFTSNIRQVGNLLWLKLVLKQLPCVVPAGHKLCFFSKNSKAQSSLCSHKHVLMFSRKGPSVKKHSEVSVWTCEILWDLVSCFCHWSKQRKVDSNMGWAEGVSYVPSRTCFQFLIKLKNLGNKEKLGMLCFETTVS